MLMICSVMGTTPKIAVIGAGISGVTAAHELIKHGLTDVTIYEALGRIGGRISTRYYEPTDGTHSYRLELGANWIHGTHGNPVFEMAKANGLLHQPGNRPKFCRYDCVDLTIDGDKIPPNLFRDVTKWYGKQMKACDAVFHSDPLPETDRSMESVLRENFKEFIEQQPAKNHDMCERILNHKFAFETSLDGCDSLSQVSRNQNGSYVTFDGPDPEIPNGFIKVVESLAEIIPDERIKLNTSVDKISYESALNSSNKLTISFSNGQTEQFDHVIVTSSINYLKQHHRSLFDPVLPMDKQESLNRCAMGTVDKIFLRFENLDFMPSTWRTIRFVWPIDVDRSQWTSRLYAFYVVNTPRQDTLSVWLTGEGAEKMEKLSDDEVIEGCLDTLSRLLKKPTPSSRDGCVDACSGGRSLPRPVDVIRTRWWSEPSILGSYSYIPVGSTVHDIEQVAQPILQHQSQKPLVQFAGEGTHPQYYSTTHGALLTGRREASLLLQYYDMN